MDFQSPDGAPDPALDAWQQATVHAEAGVSARGGSVAGVGLRGPWRPVGGTSLTWAAEGAVHRWSAPLAGGRGHAWQAVLVPLVRWRPGPAATGWFLEAGIGLSLHDRHYLAGPVRQASRWNFQDVVALGYRPARALGHEWSLRVGHFSNAGLRRPNPGEDSLTLRWSVPW